MTENQQTYVSKSCMKQHGITLGNKKNPMKHTGNFWKLSDAHTKVFFKKKELEKKLKKVTNPWVTKVIAKSSKRKQGLYKKYTKNVPPKKKISIKINKVFTNIES